MVTLINLQQYSITSVFPTIKWCSDSKFCLLLNEDCLKQNTAPLHGPKM